MVHRVSIGRLMVAIGGVALALTILREWLGPRNFLGPLGPIAILVLLGVVALLMTAGRYRRFFGGLSATGSALAVAILIAPATILGSTWDHMVGPVDRWLESPPPGPRIPPGSGITRLELISLWEELGETHCSREHSSWCLVERVLHRGGACSHSTEFQAWLMIPHGALAAIGGLLAMIPRLRPRLVACALEAGLSSRSRTFPQPYEPS